VTGTIQFILKTAKIKNIMKYIIFNKLIGAMKCIANDIIFSARKRTVAVSVIGILLFFLCSCKKIIEVRSPYTSINEENIYNDDAMAISVLTGIYTQMGLFGSAMTGNGGISFLTALSSDELTLFKDVSDARYKAYYLNSLSADDNYGTDLWPTLYGYIYTCNDAIEGLTKSETLTKSIKEQLLGEAKFVRAFCYFYLVNLYGDIPLLTSTDYKSNALVSRSPQKDVYEQIIKDLNEAKNLLKEGYLGGNLKNSDERTRPNKWAATALLARVYLYDREYIKAEIEATEVINNTTLYKIDSLNKVFLKNSQEAIWQLQPVNSGRNTEDAFYFILSESGPTSSTAGQPVYLNDHLIKAFEKDDRRFTSWVDSVTVLGETYYYPFKYKNANPNSAVTEYLMVLRLSEQYLIRAESRAEQNNVIGAQEDLDAIRSRAGLTGTLANDKSSLLDAIMNERRVELFTEWGHRWLDLKRTGKIDIIMRPAATAKGGTWDPIQALYPIPISDISRNPNLDQNPGY